MKKWMILLCLLALTTTFAQWSNQQISDVRAKHLALLGRLSDNLKESRFEMRLVNEKTFSIFSKEEEASILVSHNELDYLFSARREINDQGMVIHLTLSIPQTEAAVSGYVKKTLKSFEVQLSEESLAQGFSCDGFLGIGLELARSSSCCGTWWEGVLSAEVESLRSYYATRDQAVRYVPTHVSPKYCFVWRDGPSSTPWRPIPGTGCAHWVAHQKGIQSNPGCYDRYAIRVSQVVAGKTRYSISQARVGDIWASSDLGHCGIVIGLGSGYVRVRHCSSGSGGVVEGNFSSGNAYR